MLTLDADFSEKLKNVLSDPEAMAKITAIASSLGTTPQEAEKTEAQTAEPQSLPSAIPAITSMLPQSDPRLALLSSVKPLLKEEKRSRVDALLNALTIASVMKNLRK